METKSTELINTTVHRFKINSYLDINSVCSLHVTYSLPQVSTLQSDGFRILPKLGSKLFDKQPE